MSRKIWIQLTLLFVTLIQLWACPRNIVYVEQDSTHNPRQAGSFGNRFVQCTINPQSKCLHCLDVKENLDPTNSSIRNSNPTMGMSPQHCICRAGLYTQS